MAMSCSLLAANRQACGDCLELFGIQCMNRVNYCNSCAMMIAVQTLTVAAAPKYRTTFSSLVTEHLVMLM